MSRSIYRLALLFTISVVGLAGGAISVEAADSRARVVESSLKDLSKTNESSRSVSETPRPSTQAMLGEPARLPTEDTRASQTDIHAEVQSSLHRLRRETVSDRTPDERKARINDSLDRSQQARLEAIESGSTAPRPEMAFTDSGEVPPPSFKDLPGERIELTPTRDLRSAESEPRPEVSSDLHRLKPSQSGAAPASIQPRNPEH